MLLDPPLEYERVAILITKMGSGVFDGVIKSCEVKDISFETIKNCLKKRGRKQDYMSLVTKRSGEGKSNVLLKF